jgi:hypothetical protein
MRRFVTWIGCLLGALWIFRWFRRGSPPEPTADPAEELRRRLDESRADEQAPAEPPAAEPEAPAAGLDERRRAVHDRGRAAIDAMRGRPDDPGDS